MALGHEKRAVGVFSNAQDAQDALAELRDAGFPMSKVSVIAKDADSSKFVDSDVRDAHGNKADDGAKTGAVTGGALGGLTGLLVGLGALAIPGIGPVMLAGAAATAIATTLSGAVIGAAAGGIIGALVGLGIPEERATVYNERVNRGHYLVMLDGTEDEIRRAEAILRRRGVQEWGIYDIPNTTPIPTTHSSTTLIPTTHSSTTSIPTTHSSTTLIPTTHSSTTLIPTTHSSTTSIPTTHSSTTSIPTTHSSSTPIPTTHSSTTSIPTTHSSTTSIPTTHSSTTSIPTTHSSTTGEHEVITDADDLVVIIDKRDEVH